MFSDRINRINLIIFHGFQMKPRKRNSASAEKGPRNQHWMLFPLHYCFVSAMSERIPSKRDDVFCLFPGKAKISCLSCNPV